MKNNTTNILIEQVNQIKKTLQKQNISYLFRIFSEIAKKNSNNREIFTDIYAQ